MGYRTHAIISHGLHILTLFFTAAYIVEPLAVSITNNLSTKTVNSSIFGLKIFSL